MSIQSIDLNRLSQQLNSIATQVLRFSLVFLLLYIGGTKFFDFEAQGIKPLVENSPFLHWMYSVLSVQGVSNFFGVFEVLAGLLIAIRYWNPKLSGIGSLMTIPMFLTTLSFVFTTPKALDAGSLLGEFLMKDLALLGAGLFTAGEALSVLEK